MVWNYIIVMLTLFYANLFSCRLTVLFPFSSADALVNTGLAKLGYQYVNIGTDCSLDHVSHNSMLYTNTRIIFTQ